MPHLDIPGALLAYETAGHISSPALLLVHAGIATMRMWDPQIEALAQEHFVIRFDQRGFGGTKTEDIEFSTRQDALDLLDHLGVPAATLIGSSMGGRACIDLAVENPERVRGLITIGSGPSGFPEIEPTETEAALFGGVAQAEEAQDWALAIEREVRLWNIGPQRSESEVDPDFLRTALELHRVNRVHVAEAPIALPLGTPAYGRVAGIRVPSLFIVGEDDLAEELAHQEFLVSAVPGAEGYLVRNAAHLPSVERAGEVGSLLLEFLARHGL